MYYTASGIITPVGGLMMIVPETCRGI